MGGSVGKFQKGLLGFGGTPEAVTSRSRQATGITERFKDPLSETLSGLITPVAGQIGGRAGGPFALERGPQLRGLDLGRRVGQLSERGRFGIDPGFDRAISQLGTQLFSRASGAAAARGQLSPESRAGVIGSAIRQAAPALAGFAERSRQRELFGGGQLIQQAGGLQALRQQPQLSEEQVRQQRIQQALGATGAITGALGGVSTATGLQPAGPGFLQQFGGSFARRFGGGFGGGAATALGGSF